VESRPRGAPTSSCWSGPRPRWPPGYLLERATPAMATGLPVGAGHARDGHRATCWSGPCPRWPPGYLLERATPAMATGLERRGNRAHRALLRVRRSSRLAGSRHARYSPRCNAFSGILLSQASRRKLVQNTRDQGLIWNSLHHRPFLDRFEIASGKPDINPSIFAKGLFRIGLVTLGRFLPAADRAPLTSVN